MKRLRVVPAADRRRQAARQAGEVRRPLHAGDALLARARRRSSRRTSSKAFRFELTRVQTPRSASAWWRGLRQRRRELAAGVAAGLGIAGAGAAAARARESGAARGRGVAGAVALRAARETSASRPGASRSWSRTASTRRRRRPCGAGRGRRGAALRRRRSSAPSRPPTATALPVDITRRGGAGRALRRARHSGRRCRRRRARRRTARSLEFVKDQFRHCKTILAVGGSTRCSTPPTLPPALPTGEPDPGVVRVAARGEADARRRRRSLQRARAPPTLRARNRSAGGVISGPGPPGPIR